MAFGLLLALVIGHLVPLDQAFSGFGSPAVIAVAAIFVISAGLERTGAAALVSRPLRLLAGRSYLRLVVILMAVTGLLSAFMNNLVAVGVLLPVTMSVAHRRRASPGLLLPLAYAARFGGNLTLIAGPTNLLLADILSRRGVANLHLFDFVPIGLPMLVVGTAWMAAVGWRLLPRRPPEELLRVMRREARLVSGRAGPRHGTHRRAAQGHGPAFGGPPGDRGASGRAAASGGLRAPGPVADRA